MVLEGCTDIKKPFLAGNSREITFQIVDKATGDGFKPSTLAMTVYDVSPTGAGALGTVYLIGGSKTDTTVGQAIVNSQQAVDVLSLCDATGHVQVYLTPEDTALEVPDIIVHTPYQRRVLFAWTWGSPALTAMHQIIIRIQPNRAHAAT